MHAAAPPDSAVDHRPRRSPAGVLPLPASLRSPHLLARVRGFDAAVVEEDLAEIESAARRWANGRLRPAEIDLAPTEVERGAAQSRVTSALRDSLAASLAVRGGRTPGLPRPEVVVCRWASLHTDDASKT